MRTQVAIIGGGPAGLLLSHMLDLNKIESIVLERKSRAYVLERIRAGVLEPHTVELLREVGLGERMDREGHVHDGSYIAWAGRDRFLIDTRKYTGKPMMAYGQTAITEDLYAARDKAGGHIIDEADGVQLHDLTTDRPYVTFSKEGKRQRVDCDFVAGCDGFHGISRKSIPAAKLKTFDKEYPFGWLGIMSETPPFPDIVYAHHERGSALASMRSPMLSRYYIQCDLDAKIEDWPDERFWKELKARFPKDIADRIVTGPSIEKSIAPLRSFVAEPMQYGRMFMAGDSAHIVPPTGAKGMNLAFADVMVLARGFETFYRSGRMDILDGYSQTCLPRVWKAQRFSWWMTQMLHRYSSEDDFDMHRQLAELDYVTSSRSGMTMIAENYVGLPFAKRR